MPVPYTFGTATSSIPLSQLDSNFATAITIGNTAVQLGNTVTTLNNMTLANVTISSGNVTITNVSVTTANVSGTANVSTMVIIGNETVGGNTTVTGNISANNATLTTNLTLSGGTANGVGYLNTSKVLTTGSAITFDGTNFATTGTASATKLIPTGGSATGNGMWLPASNQIAFSTNGTEAMRVDASQNVGIGTSSPSSLLHTKSGTGANNIFTLQADTKTWQIRNQQDGTFGIFQSTDNQWILQSDTTGTRFYTAGSERMRIDSSGNLLVGTTTINTISPRLTLLGATAGKQWSCGPTSGNDNFFVYNQASAGVYVSYGSTSWSASSDERIKTKIIPFKNALDKVCTLRAGTGRYLTDEESVSRSFLIAQDVQAVLPEAINIQNDEIGTLGLQYTDVIPLLVASIKELKAINDTQAETINAQAATLAGQSAALAALTARVVALESKVGV